MIEIISGSILIGFVSIYYIEKNTENNKIPFHERIK